MKRKIISMMTIVALVGTMLFSVMAENGETWETWDTDGANIALTIATSGEYTLGDNFELKASTYSSNATGKTGTRAFIVDAYKGSSSEAVQNVQYFDGSDWKDISEYNVEITFKNDVGRMFRFQITQDGIYTISSRFIASDSSMAVSCVTRYLTIKDGTFTVSKKEPVETTTEEITTEEPTTEEPTTEEPTTEEPTTEEPTTEEPTTEEPATEEPTTEEPTTEKEFTTTEETTEWVIPTEPESITAEPEITTEPESIIPETDPEETTKAPETTKAVTTKAPETTTRKEVTTKAPETTTEEEITTQPAPEPGTTVAETKKPVAAPAIVKIKKIAKKKKSAKKIKVTIAKINDVNGYQACVYKNKKSAKNNKNAIATKVLKKNKTVITVKNKALKKKKKLFVRVRAYKVVDGNTYYGAWSKIKKVKMKKVKKKR